MGYRLWAHNLRTKTQSILFTLVTETTLTLLCQNVYPLPVSVEILLGTNLSMNRISCAGD